MTLLGLKSGDPLPSGGYSFVVTVQSGSGSADTWTKLFGPVFAERCGITLHPGSLNLWAAHNISWDQPREISVEDKTAEFCPVILEESAVGVAFRMNRQTRRYLETMSPVGLRNHLNLQDGQRISVRLLPGNALGSCLTSA
jgi:CTP-dependent riboflavin kinase